MKGTYRADAIILKRKNVGETDRIITAFTSQYGKLRLVAKGVRKVGSRRAPHLEIFSHAVILAHPTSSMDMITEVSAVDSYPNIRKDLSRVGVAYFLCELVDLLLPEKQEHRDIFILLTDALAGIDKSDKDMYANSRRFALELLWTLGFLPREQKLQGGKLQAFIESVAERELRTPHFIRKML